MTEATSRPFEILGLQQVAIGGSDKARLQALWGGLFGIPTIGAVP